MQGRPLTRAQGRLVAQPAGEERQQSGPQTRARTGSIMVRRACQSVPPHAAQRLAFAAQCSELHPCALQCPQNSLSVKHLLLR